MTLIDGIKKRFSPMVFTAETISEETIQTLLEAARWSASSFNEQPWRFIVGKHPGDDTYKKIHSALIEYNQDWAITAPVLMLALAKKNFTHLPDTPNAHAWYDTGMAVSSMVIQGASMGIQAHQMGGFDSNKAREALTISEDYDIIAAIAIGHAGDPDILPEMYRERARQPRGRKEVSEILL
jgi:nitroreductase